MRNRPICFVSGCLGSARVSRAGDGVPPSRTFLAPCQDPRSTFLGKTVSARRRNQHARRVRYPAKLEQTKLGDFAYKFPPTPRVGLVCPAITGRIAQLSFFFSRRSFFVLFVAGI